LLSIALFSVSFSVLFGSLHEANAFPTTVEFQNGVLCDDLDIPTNVEELGLLGQFRPIRGDAISLSVTAPPFNPILGCRDGIGDTNPFFVFIKNENSRTFSDLWFIVDLGSSFSNVDGLARGTGTFDIPVFTSAFKIDSIGNNKPLLAESINANGFFEPGEIWVFVVDGWDGDFTLTPRNLATVGISSGDRVRSTASIIAVELDSDGDGTPDSQDGCPNDPNKTEPGERGCGNSEQVIGGEIIGGEFLPIDSTALILAGDQSFSWMIPVVVSVLGIGLFVVSRKSVNS